MPRIPLRPRSLVAALLALSVPLGTPCAPRAAPQAELALRSATLAAPAGCTPEATAAGGLTCAWQDAGPARLSLTLDEGPASQWLRGTPPADPDARLAAAFEGFLALLDAQPGFRANTSGRLKPDLLPAGAAGCIRYISSWQFPPAPAAAPGPAVDVSAHGLFCLSDAADPAATRSVIAEVIAASAEGTPPPPDLATRADRVLLSLRID